MSFLEGLSDLENKYNKCVRPQSLSHVRHFAIPCLVAHQAPLSMGFSRQEYWSGVPFPSPGDFPHQGIEASSLASPALAGSFFTVSHLEAQTYKILS